MKHLRLDYCNSLLMGCPNTVFYPMQKVQNSAARLILKAPRQQPCTPLLHKLHWLPISQRIKYKTACISFNSITGSAPGYISEILHLYTPSRSLRSSSDSRLLRQIQYNRKSHGFRSLSHLGLQFWNSLPKELRHSPSISSFKSNLKKHLFQQYFDA